MAWWVPAAIGLGTSLLGGGTKAKSTQQTNVNTTQDVSGSGDSTSETRTNLRDWSGQETQMANELFRQFPGLLQTLKGGAAGRGKGIAEGLFKTMGRDIRGATHKAMGEHRFQSGLGGAGPSSVVGRGTSQILQGQNRALTDARAQAEATGAQIGTHQFGADLAAVQGVLGGHSDLVRNRLVGAGQTTTSSQKFSQKTKGTQRSSGSNTQPTNWLGDVGALAGYGYGQKFLGW